MDSPPRHKQFIPLENNPAVMTPLAHELGLDARYAFHDLYSLYDDTLLALVPRPALALLTTIPPHPTWAAANAAEEAAATEPAALDRPAAEDPVLYFPQYIGNACGLIGMLHCVLNCTSSSTDIVIPGSPLAALREQALQLRPVQRGQLLVDSDLLEGAHSQAAVRGDTAAPPAELDGENHFVAFVKGKDGRLYEVAGARRGAVDRGALAEDEDVLSPKAIELGLGRVVRMLSKEGQEGSFAFSATVLA